MEPGTLRKKYFLQEHPLSGLNTGSHDSWHASNMISCGVILTNERLNPPPYAQTLIGGEGGEINNLSCFIKRNHYHDDVCICQLN